jgi:hypothetical protein
MPHDSQYSTPKAIILDHIVAVIGGIGNEGYPGTSGRESIGHLISGILNSTSFHIGFTCSKFIQSALELDFISPNRNM